MSDGAGSDTAQNPASARDNMTAWRLHARFHLHGMFRLVNGVIVSEDPGQWQNQSRFLPRSMKNDQSTESLGIVTRGDDNDDNDITTLAH
jgi:hypothetical protein